MNAYIRSFNMQLANLKSLADTFNETATVADADEPVKAAVARVNTIIDKLTSLPELIATPVSLTTIPQPISGLHKDSWGRLFGTELHKRMDDLDTAITLTDFWIDSPIQHFTAALEASMGKSAGNCYTAKQVPYIARVHAARALQLLGDAIIALVRSAAQLLVSARAEVVVEAVCPRLCEKPACFSLSTQTQARDCAVHWTIAESAPCPQWFITEDAFVPAP